MERIRRLVLPPARSMLRGLFKLVAPQPRLEGGAIASAPFSVDDVGGALASARPAHKSLRVYEHRGDDVRAPRPASVPAPVPRTSGPRDLPRILLLNPPRFDGIPVVRLWRSEYLFVRGNHVPVMDLGYFAARVKHAAIVRLIDANAEDLDDQATLDRVRAFRPDIIVVKGVRNLLPHDLRVPLRHAAEHPHVKVILSCRGCIDAEARVFAQFPALHGIARGEIDAFAEDIAAGGALDQIPGMSVPGQLSAMTRTVRDLDEVPMPDLDALPPIWYTGYKIAYYGVPSGYFLTTSRGCPYQCSFCMVGGIDERPFKYRRRSADNVLEEMRMLRRRFGIRDIYVYDEIFTMPGHTERICELMVKANLGMQWICEGKPDLVREGMLRVMKQAGCAAIYYGVESGDDRILGEVRKGHVSAHAMRAIRMTQAAGMLAAAFVMVGFPGETWESYLNTIGFLLATEPDLIRYDFLLPYPVTRLHREMTDAGLLTADAAHGDRRISPYHDAPISLRSRALGPRALKLMDTLIKLTFSAELARTPIPITSPLAGAAP